ncbi:MAG TPA: DoxX family protein [Thermoanaerobaculia bacterium]|nr:DoxX family protein [Thermoanaerobaculia bacterium]
MAPFIVLCVVVLLSRAVGAVGVHSLDSWPAAVRVGLAVMFCFTAVAHFGPMHHDLVAMVPPWVPQPQAVVFLTGLLEVAGAVGLLLPRTRRAAALGLILFLVAVFPANVHAAQQGVLLRGEPATPLLPRLLLQLLFIGLVWWSGWRHGGPSAEPVERTAAG